MVYRLTEGLCLVAGEQTHGVGQHGKWLSSDRDVKLSLVLPDVQSPLEHALLNCTAAFAVQRTLTALVNRYSVSIDLQPCFEVKLVNDVLVHHQGAYRKISGSLGVGQQDLAMRSLLQQRDGFQFPESHIVLGIGVNLVTLPRPVADPRFPPISLEEIIGVVVPRETAIGTLLRNFAELSYLARTQPVMFLHALQQHLATNNGEILVVQKNGLEHRGRIEDLGPDGIRICGEGTTIFVALDDLQRVVPTA